MAEIDYELLWRTAFKLIEGKPVWGRREIITKLQQLELQAAHEARRRAIPTFEEFDPKAVNIEYGMGGEIKRVTEHGTSQQFDNKATIIGGVGNQ